MKHELSSIVLFCMIFLGIMLFVTADDTATHAEIYEYNSHGSARLITIDSAGTYHNVTNLTMGSFSGMSYQNNDEVNGGTKIIAQEAGTYKACLTMSFSSSANGGTYGVSIGKNSNQNNNRDCYARRDAATSIGNMGLCCILEMVVDDWVSVMIENEDTNRNMNLETLNFNLIRIS